MDMSNQSNGTNIILLFIVAAFIAGFAAYIYIKNRSFDVKNRTLSQILVSEFFISFGVTFAMVVGSFTGAFLMSSNIEALANSITPYAITFFFEVYIAILWGYYLRRKYNSFKWIHTALFWLGLFFIFTIFSVVGYLSVIEIPLNLPYIVVNDFYGAISIAQHPIEYIKSVFTSSGGNQFIIVKEFPKWSIYLLAFSILGVGFEHLKSHKSAS